MSACHIDEPGGRRWAVACGSVYRAANARIVWHQIAEHRPDSRRRQRRARRSRHARRVRQHERRSDQPTAAGYNTANSKIIEGKKKTYGFVYWVNKVGSNDARGQHLQPGVYQRVMTPFGSSLKPILIFVKQANYKQRLDFFGIVTNTINRDFASNFDEAFDQAVATALK